MSNCKYIRHVLKFVYKILEYGELFMQQTKKRKRKRRKRKTNKTVRILAALLILLCLVLIIIKIADSDRAEPEYTQESIYVQVFNGTETISIIPEAGVALNTFSEEQFYFDENGRPVYSGDDYTLLQGVDVSSFQGSIDWQQVKDSGIDFAVVRAGSRAYGTDGEIIEDKNFLSNVCGAASANLKVGAYFFSQAITEQEAVEEADYVVSLLAGTELDLPIYFDWERIQDASARTDSLDGEKMTACAKAFCERIEECGYEAGIYLYLESAYNGYTLSELTDYDFWCAQPGAYPYFYYAHSIWQYSFSGTVPGISAQTDMNVMYVKK